MGEIQIPIHLEMEEHDYFYEADAKTITALKYLQ